jgi:hypothetical protein
MSVTEPLVPVGTGGRTACIRRWVEVAHVAGAQSATTGRSVTPNNINSGSRAYRMVPAQIRVSARLWVKWRTEELRSPRA